MTTIKRIVFNQTSVFDAIQQLADLDNKTFYVDNNKDVHFEPYGYTSSNQTLYSGNIISADFNEKRDSVFNQIWVYGDRSLSQYKEIFNSNDTPGGSVFDLLYKPHNTSITVSGLVIQPGGIYNMSASTGSTVKYLVNYEDKQIIFTSGTNQGDNIPASGVTIIVDYQRLLPIVKVGDDYTSQSLYGKRVKVIVDKDIKDPQTAEDLMKAELALYNNPIKEGNIEVQGIINIEPGQTCTVDLPYQNINNIEYDIIETVYKFSKNNNLSDNVLEVKVNGKNEDLTDILKSIILDVKKLKGGDIDETDLITRYQTATGSLSVQQSGCTIQERTITGSVLIWGHSVYGIWGTGSWGIEGSAFTDWTTTWSGNYLV